MIKHLFTIIILIISWGRTYSQEIYYYHSDTDDEITYLISINIQTCEKKVLGEIPFTVESRLGRAGDYVIGVDGKYYTVIDYNSPSHLLLSLNFNSQEIIVIDTFETIAFTDQFPAITVGPDSLIYMCAGQRPGPNVECVTYDYRTNEIIHLGVFNSPIDGNYSSLFFYEGEMYILGTYLARVDLENNQIIPLTGEQFRSGAAVHVRYGCDSTAVYVAGGNLFNADGTPRDDDVGLVSLLDLNTYETTTLCPLGGEFGRTVGFAVPWEQQGNIPCRFEIDLDEDDSSLGENVLATSQDYVDTSYCTEVFLTLTDNDLQLMGNTVPDSIFLRGDFPDDLMYQYNGDNPDIRVIEFVKEMIILIEPGTSIEALDTFLKSISLSGENIEEDYEGTFQFISFRDDIPLDTATTYIEFLVEDNDTYDANVRFCGAGYDHIVMDNLLRQLPADGVWLTQSPLEAYENGTYLYEYPNEHCPNDTVIINLQVFDAATNITGDSAICNQDPVMLSLDRSMNIESISWSDNSTDATLEVMEAGTYYVTVNYDFGCRARDTFTVYEAQFDFFMEADCEDGVEINIDTLDNAFSIEWSTGDENTTDIIIDQNGLYTVSLTDQYGCESIIDFSVDDCVGTTDIIPNIFSPKGDGVNDLFDLELLPFNDYVLSIYDRWGNIVYYCESRNDSCSWDGKSQSNNRDVIDGVYVYLIQPIGNSDESVITGDLTIVR